MHGVAGFDQPGCFLEVSAAQRSAAQNVELNCDRAQRLAQVEADLGLRLRPTQIDGPVGLRVSAASARGIGFVVGHLADPDAPGE